MTKLFSPRRIYCCCCCFGGSGPQNHHVHHRHAWRKTVVFGVFVFSLYFALLSFVSFLAVSNHHSSSSLGRAAGGGVLARGPSAFLSHQLTLKNGSASLISLDTNQTPNFAGLPFGGANGSRDLGLLTIQKTGVGSNTRYSVHASHPRRDPAYASDIIRSQAIFKCIPVHFRQESSPVVALASFPGSGNTWLRYLLQLSTGIFTGSVYKDFALLRNGFPGESLTNGRVLAIKTHESGPMARSQFEKAILLIRKPSESILAEFNRRAAGHIGHAGRDKYTRNAGRYWSSFVAQKGKSWTETNLDWIEGFHGPLLVSMYHQLVQNTSQELTTILDFLGKSVPESVMSCVISNKEGIYRRRKKNAQFNPYTPKMEKFLATQERIVYNAVQNRVRRDSRTMSTVGFVHARHTKDAKNNHNKTRSSSTDYVTRNKNIVKSRRGVVSTTL